MKIALVHPRLDHRGGAENVVMWMARGLQSRGHEVVVATRYFSDERWNDGDWEGIPLVLLTKEPFAGLQPRRYRKLGPGRSLYRLLRSVDVMVAHNPPAHVWAVEAARRMQGVRTVWFCEEPSAQIHWRATLPHFAAALDDIDAYPWMREVAERWMANGGRAEASKRFATKRELDAAAAGKLDLVLGNSAFTAANARRVYGVAAEACILGLPPPDKPAPVADGPPYLIWVTSGVPHKNSEGFLEAISIAVRQHGLRDLRVRAVGLRGEVLGRRIASLGIESLVHREDWIDDASLNSLIAGARLLAYPSIDEPFGLLPLQAMAHGRPVLASGLGGPAETVVDGESGVHVDPLDPGDMAARLAELWCDPARCDALGAAGLERYRARFTFDRFLDRFEEAAFGR